jgi:uncharacterized protein (DUF305 family)
MNKIWITGVAAVVVIAGGVVYVQSKDSSTKPKTSGNTLSSQTRASMPTMQKQFEGYKGAQYDKIFLASMIAHHQGAVQMAQMASSNAKHQEIKDLATNIISAQNTEISQMQSWQTALGYTKNDSATQAVVKQMQGEMDSMMGQLNGKMGDEFDKAFLAQMMMHHQSAIDMSKPAAINAGQEEVKTLASNIITAQTKEVSEMISWQTQWGYKTQSSSSDSMSGMSM